MTPAERFILGLTMTGAAFGAGFLIGEARQQTPRPEAPRTAVVHPSGAITLARTTQPPPPKVSTPNEMLSLPASPWIVSAPAPPLIVS